MSIVRTPPTTSTDIPSGRAWDALWVLGVAASYYAGTQLGFALTRQDQPIAVFWPPNAILLAALLVSPIRQWWQLLLAVVPAHVLAQLGHGIPVTTSLGWLIGNSAEALLGATLIAAFGRPRVLFETTTGVVGFLVFAMVTAPVVTSFIDAAFVVATGWGRDFWVVWVMRLLSNMLAQLTIVPTFVVCCRAATFWSADGRRLLEAVCLTAALVFVSLLAFHGESLLGTSIPALIYLPLPVLLWAAMRFNPAVLSGSLLTITVISTHSLMHGRGPFISSSVASSVLSMQVFLATIGAPLLLLAAARHEQRRTEASLRDTSGRLIDAQERERQRIARDLHDNIGQRLTLVEIELDRIAAADHEWPRHEGLSRLRDQMSLISQAVWEVSHGLFPSNLEYLGLVNALSRLCTETDDDLPIRIRCETRGIPEQLEIPAEVSLCLYRVAQEAIQNVVRHSLASQSVVRLQHVSGRLVLDVVDDGIGFDEMRCASGLGFASIRERLKAVDGGVTVQSAPAAGTRVRAWVPLRERTIARSPLPVMQPAAAGRRAPAPQT